MGTYCMPRARRLQRHLLNACLQNGDGRAARCNQLLHFISTDSEVGHSHPHCTEEEMEARGVSWVCSDAHALRKECS